MKKVRYVLISLVLFMFSATFVNAGGSKTISNGTYMIFSAINEDYAIDLSGGKVKNKQNIQLYKDNRSTAQAYTVTYLNNGYYKITSAKNNNYSLDVKGAGKKNGTNVQLYKYNSKASAQQWIIKDAGNGYYYIISKCNNLYVDVKGGKAKNKQSIQMYKGNKSKAQKFVFSPVVSGSKTISDGKYQIASALNSNLVVDLYAGTVQNKQNIQMHSYNATDAEHWNVEYLNNGYYKITSAKNNNYSLDVFGGYKKRETNIILYKYHGGLSEQFAIKDVGGGYYTILSRVNGLALDVAGGKSTSGTNLQSYTSNSSNAQKFYFSKVVEGEKIIDTGLYTIKLSSDKTKALELNSGDSTVSLNNISTSNTFKWYIKYNNDNTYSIIPYLDYNKKLESKNMSRSENTNIVVNSTSGIYNQSWVIKANEDGTYMLYNKHNGLALTLNNNSIDLESKNSDKNQSFIIEKSTIEESSNLEEGNYILMSNLSSHYLVSTNSTVSDNSSLFLNATSGGLYEKWYIEKLDNNYYRIHSLANTSYVLCEEDGKVYLKTLDESSNNKWKIQKLNNGEYMFYSNDGAYLSLSNTSLSTSNTLKTDVYNASNKISFKLYKTIGEEASQTLKDGYYTISSALDSNKNIDLTSGSLSNGNTIQLYSSAKSSNQKWHIQHISNGYYKITSIKKDSKSFDVKGYNTASGTALQLYDYTGNINQEWMIKEDENGYYTFISNCGGNAIEVSGSNTANKTKIVLGELSDSLSQKFVLTEVKDTYKGLDASTYNHEINWQKVKNSNINFAIVRLGFGGNYESQDDDTFLYNAKECAKNKIPFGLYIYSYAENEKEIKGEVEHTMRLINKLSSTTKNYMKLPVFLDMEEDSYAKYGKTYLTDLADKYCQAINNKGYTCGIYANKKWLTKNLNASYLEKKYMIWLAHYTGANSFANANNYKSDYTGAYNIWQFTSKGSVSGISGNVDLNLGYNLF